jgi:hypothetical protein
MPSDGAAEMTATREPTRHLVSCVGVSTGEDESPLPWAKYRRKSEPSGGYAQARSLEISR